MQAALLLGAIFLLSSGSSSGQTRAAPPPRAPPPEPKGIDWEDIGKTGGEIIKGAKSIIDAFKDW